MKKISLLFVLISILVFTAGQAMATIMITLDPIPDKVHPLENLYVDINISGLQSGDVDTLLGAFSLDLLYDSDVLTPIISVSTPGSELGDVLLGEAVWNIDYSVPGALWLAEVSLLEASSATCIFCFPPYLDALQSDSFTLATIAFFVHGAPGVPVTYLDTDHVVLSDADGFQVMDVRGNIAPVATPIASVRIPEPGTAILLTCGLIGMLKIRRKSTC